METTTLRVALAKAIMDRSELRRRSGMSDAYGKALSWEAIDKAMDEIPDGITVGTLRRIAAATPGMRVIVTFAEDESEAAQ